MCGRMTFAGTERFFNMDPFIPRTLEHGSSVAISNLKAREGGRRASRKGHREYRPRITLHMSRGVYPSRCRSQWTYNRETVDWRCAARQDDRYWSPIEWWIQLKEVSCG